MKGLAKLLSELDELIREAKIDELPALLGRLTEAEERVRLRLAQAAGPPAGPSTQSVEEAAAIAATTPPWLLTVTRGLALRQDLSRKQLVRRWWRARRR